MKVNPGSINVSVYFYIVEDVGGTNPGEPKTGLLFSDIETGGSASYMRQGAARVDLTLITLASASAAHSDGGFILVDDTNMPGLYRCDYPDAVFATGIDLAVCQIIIASAKNAIARPVLVKLTIPNVNIIELGGGSQSLTDLKDFADEGYNPATNKITGVLLTDTVTTLTNKTGFALSTAGILAIWHQAVAAIVTAGSIGKHLIDEITSVRMAVLTDWINDGRLDDILDAIPTEVMRGTDGANTTTPPTVAEIADGVTDELLAGHTDVGSLGKAISDILTLAGNVTKIAGNTEAANKLSQSARTIVLITIGVGSTTTNIVSNLSEATNDHYNGRSLLFVTGALAEQGTDVVDYDGISNDLTVTALTEAPANGNLAVLV